MHPPFFFFFNDTATTEIYTLSLHDALPISGPRVARNPPTRSRSPGSSGRTAATSRSEEHTSELQSLTNLVCRLLLEKKKRSVPGPRERARDRLPDRSRARSVRAPHRDHGPP